ncbi:MAG: hypothetical protein E7590_06465 [Ruminococcaceae bacterium]|nr:hypothetical protein [Oscillospiraceae bacterium]
MKKRILCFVLVLLLLLPTAVACKQGGKELALIRKGSCEHRIVYPEGDRDAATVANTLAKILHTLTGVLPEVVADSEEESDKEILVGYTNREASERVLEEIKTQSNTFAVAVKGEQLVLTATGKVLSHSAELFLTSVKTLLGGSYREGYLTLPHDLFYIGSVQLPITNAGLIASTAQLALQKEGKESPLSDMAENERLCSIASDGTYRYAITKVVGEEKTTLYQLTTAGTPVNSTNKAALGAGASLCYNGLTGLLAVAHGGSEPQRVSLIDPASLTVQDTVMLDVAISAIAYLPQSNRYLVKLQKENVCYLLDGAFRREGEPIALPRVLASGTVKDMTADDRYTYFLKDDGSILIADRRTTRYQSLELPFDLTQRTMVSLCLEQKSILFGAVSTPNKSEDKLPDAILSSTMVQTAQDAAPGDLFTEALREEVDTTGLTNTKMFDTYTVAGSPAKNTVMQGGCTDGRYAYICMENQAGNYSNTYLHDTRIVKVDLATKKLVKLSEPLKLHHSNDMCYNALTGQLIVLHNGKEANVLSFVDPETLTVIGTQILPFYVYSIAHEPTTDRYVVGKSGGRNYAVLDGNFKVIRSHLDVGPYTNYTDTNPVTQGIDCDEKYIYSVLGVKYTETDGDTTRTLWRNYLVVHDWSGKYLFAKILPGMTVESENVFHVGNTVYVGCNGGKDPVYRFEIGE